MDLIVFLVSRTPMTPFMPIELNAVYVSCIFIANRSTDARRDKILASFESNYYIV